MADYPRKLSVWRYDTTRQQWSNTAPRARYHQKPRKQTSLRVVTYNIWFHEQHQELRSQYLFAMLQHSRAHIICLQEISNKNSILVTTPVLQDLISQPWVQDRYMLSDIDGRTFLNTPKFYGVVMLIHKYFDLQQLLSFPFDTRQGRQLIFAKIKIGTEMFLIGTVHLESMQGRNVYRSRQLQICNTVFNKYAMNHPNVTRLLMGDFNFDALGPENPTNMNILKYWHDLWLKLNGSDNLGLTYGDVRFDRIMFRSLRVIPTNIRIIGNRPIGQFPKTERVSNTIFDALSFFKQHDDMTTVFTSDHFGLMADFDLRRI